LYNNPVLGIDVSMRQGDIDWHAIERRGVKFAWIKTSEGGWDPQTGKGYVDPKWYRNVAEARKTNIVWGGYHFARPNGPNWRADALNEAEWFVHCGGMSGPLPGCLDLEDTELNREGTIEWAEIFCSRAAALGKHIHTVLYAGAYFPAGSPSVPAIANDWRLASCPWWMPSYTSRDVNPDPFVIHKPAYNGSRVPEVWQYTSNGTMFGYGSRIDLNITSQENLDALLGTPSQSLPAQEEDEMKSTIIHVDTRTTPNLRQRLVSAGIGEEDGFENVALQTFGDWTMRRVYGQEILKFAFYGVPELRDEAGNVVFVNSDPDAGVDADENFWDLFDIKDRR
jgi:GH25 family lysozyme M1 (1,4-beta-N-acetylmuramidase)